MRDKAVYTGRCLMNTTRQNPPVCACSAEASRRDFPLARGNPRIYSGEEVTQLTAEQRRAYDLAGIKGLEDIEISGKAYQLFGISEEERGTFKSLTGHPEKVDDGQAIWVRSSLRDYSQQRVIDSFTRQRKISKEAMQSYIGPYLEKLEALVGKQVSKGDVHPPWEKAWQRVFRTQAEYYLKFYDEGRHNGTRTTNIVLSLPGRFDEGTVARIQYVPIQSRAQIIKAQ